MPSRLTTVLLLPMLAVAVVSFILVRSQQGDGSTLLARQQHAHRLTPAAVAAVVQAAPDPVTHTRGIRADCQPLGSAELLNPWRCSIIYPRSVRIQYEVTVDPNGAYIGRHQIVHMRRHVFRSTGHITGCCVVVP